MSNVIKWLDVAHLYLKSSVLVGEYIPHKPYSDGTSEGFETVLNWYMSTDRADRVYLPFLHPLPSMTEEDARELYLVDFGDPYDNSEISALDWYNRRQFDELEDSRIEYTIGSPAGWLYLLNKGFDLFGLIEAGEALDATKIGGGE